MTADVAREHDLTIDEAGFEQEMNAQRERARKASSFAIGEAGITDFHQATIFLGYTTTQAEASVAAVFVGGERRFELSEGEALVALNQTPFYAESGGQVGDTGQLLADGLVADVLDTQKQGDMWVHRVAVRQGALSEGQTVQAQVDATRRINIVRHHSATHLLHAALRSVLGTHVEQKGSLNAPENLRFDFSHAAPISQAELVQIEQMMNQQVLANITVETEEMSVDAAKAKGAMALFGEKYGDVVRVVSMGEASIELCGGIHVQQTGQIGLIKIVSEGAVASGVRRIEAVAGEFALQAVQQSGQYLSQLTTQFKVTADKVFDRVEALQAQIKSLEKQVESANLAVALAKEGELLAQAVSEGSAHVLVAQLDGVDGKSLRELAQRLQDKLQPSVIVLASVMDGKIALISAVSKDLHGKVKAGELVGQLASAVGGKGGGRPDMAQAGGSDIEALAKVLESSKEELLRILS